MLAHGISSSFPHQPFRATARAQQAEARGTLLPAFKTATVQPTSHNRSQVGSLALSSWGRSRADQAPSSCSKAGFRRSSTVMVAARARPNGNGYGSFTSPDEVGKMMQLEHQVFELKQRLVEAEVKRQAAEKARTESSNKQQQLQGRLSQTRWMLAGVVVLLLLAAAALAWAALEAPPLGTVALGGEEPGVIAVLAGGAWGAVRAAAERVAAAAGTVLALLGVRRG